MSILIKGMEMPAPGEYSHIRVYHDGTVTAQFADGEEITLDYTAVPAADVREVKWIPFETRPMDEEERAYYSEQYGFALADEKAVIYCSQMPEHGQEVLVCNRYGHVWLDIFDDDPDFGVGFETNGDMDGLVAWMPLPKPYQPPNCGADMRERAQLDDYGDDMTTKMLSQR